MNDQPIEVEATHNAHCDCCTSSGATSQLGIIYDHGETSRIKANLCAECKRRAHVAGHCKAAGCGVIVWTCARMAHVSLAHPGLLEIRERMPEIVDNPRFKYVGRIYPDAGFGKDAE